MGRRKLDDLIAFQRTHRRLPNASRLVEQRPTCAWERCRKPFTPKRPHQRFCDPKCRWAEWSATHPRLKTPKAEAS